MNVIFSIKPKYVKEIIDGKKKYEFRKAIPKSNTIESAFIYSSAPTQKIVGKFKPGKVICDTPENLWAQLYRWAGINEEEFFTYFEGKKTGFAIAIDELHVFEPPIDPEKLRKDFVPPQSFCYVEKYSSSIPGIGKKA